MQAHASSRLRRAGAAILTLGVIGFAISMFLGAATARPSVIAANGIVAGLGLVLVLRSLPRGRPQHDSPERRLEDLLSVFFTFGTLGPIVVMILSGGNANFVAGLVAILLSGVISAVWAACFIWRVYWLIPVAIALSAFLPTPVFDAFARLGAFENFGGLSPGARMGILGLEALASLLVGYILLVRFISRVERQAARAEAELATAAAIHERLVPAIEHTTSSWHVRAHALPCATMGGDLIDLIEHADQTDLVVADVTGHGVRAGVVLALAKGVLRAELARDAPLHEAAARANRAIAGMLDANTFVTAALARLPNNPAQPVQLVIAGHPPVLVRRGDARVERFDSGGLPLGVAIDERYDHATTTLAPGDALVLYTDGISEAAPPGGRQFGIDGVVRTLRDTPDADAAELERAIFEAARSHAGSTFEDDRSVAVVTRV